MDGIHDLGGREGFGPVDRHGEDLAFHAPWEARVMGMVRAMSRPRDWSIDWFRHCRELIDPVDYLTRPYYDQWLQTYGAMMVNSGVVTVDELASGKSDGRDAGLVPPASPDSVGDGKAALLRFDRPIDDAPKYAVGDAVRAIGHGASGHTRLPAYARGRRGTVHASRGAHVFPDAKAVGEDRAEPLYTVAFDAAELWAEAAGRRDRVYVDLWESYLERR